MHPDVLHTAPTLHPSHLPYSRFITAVVVAAVGAHVSISKKKAPGHPMIVFSTAEGGSSFFLGCSPAPALQHLLLGLLRAYQLAITPPTVTCRVLRTHAGEHAQLAQQQQAVRVHHLQQALAAAHAE